MALQAAVCGTVLSFQLTSSDACCDNASYGMSNFDCSVLSSPASNNRTLTFSFADSRLAKTQPAVPAPTKINQQHATKTCSTQYTN